MDLSQFLNFRNKLQLILDVFLWLISGLILLFIRHQSFKILPSFLTCSPEPVRVAAFFLLLIALFVLFKELIKWLRVRWWLLWNKNKIYIFNNKDWSKKWISNGKTEIVNNGDLLVKSSRAGCLLKNHYWKDFKISFEMKYSPDKFGDQNRFGIIFRAEDLDNYFLIEIGENAEFYKTGNKIEINGEKEDEKKYVSSIKPHVKYKGIWEIMSVTEINKPFNFSADFVKASLEVKGDTVSFFYKDDPIYKWILPEYIDVNHVESGVRDNMEKTKGVILGGAFAGHVQKIPFRLKYGLVGFRAHLNHAGTYIKKLRIEPL